MKTSSRKAKGRNLQKLVCATLLKYFDWIPTSDILSRPMGSQGSDIILSNKAKEVFPYRVECKNQESYKNLYDAYEQAASQKETGEPLLVIKMNRKPPVVVVELTHFMDLVLNNVRYTTGANS